jgi:hypothetical protein
MATRPGPSKQHAWQQTHAIWLYPNRQWNLLQLETTAPGRFPGRDRGFRISHQAIANILARQGEGEVA